MSATQDAATILWDHWRHRRRLAQLPAACRPATRGEGYAIQAELGAQSGYTPVGWKIAATSEAGQRHINVDGPLAGRLYANRRLTPGTPVPLAGNCMQVAEAEFAFRLGASLPPRAAAYAAGEVLSAVASLHPAIEVPDSRYEDFTAVGGPSLIADTACACWFLLGTSAPAAWRTLDLAAHPVRAHRNGTLVAEGGGFNVLGDPRAALTWIANELRTHGHGLRAGDVVITGTCVVPVHVDPGDRVDVDFGVLGSMSASFVA